MNIAQILDKIDENQLFVPAFQRQYVWKRDNVKALMSSLIKDYPTGTLLTWETSSPPELKGEKQYDPKQGAVKLILDGQQRITSLYLIIRGEIPPYYTEKEIGQDTRNLYVNIESLELQYYKKQQMQNNPLWINLTDIFKKTIRPSDVRKSLRENQEVTDQLTDLIEDNFYKIRNILDRPFKEQSVPIKATIREAIDIFYIVNASGINLTEAELALAQISGYWPQARKEILEKKFKLAESGFVFELDFFVYALLGVVHNSGADMSKLHSEDNRDRIISAWKKLESQILDYVLNLIKQRAFVDHTKEINSVYALIPVIVYAFNHDGHIPEEKIKKAVKWFYYSQLRQRYISQLPQKLDKDIKVVLNAENPFDELLSIIKSERSLEVQPEEFVGVGISHPLYSTMRWMFKSRGAICFTTGLSISKNMGKKYSLEWDHIFPYSLLKENGYNMANRHKYQLAQEVTNRAVLTQYANRSKSNMNPDDYLNGVQENFPNSLKLQSIPKNSELWKLENFELFLSERRKLLANEINEFLSSITEIKETDVLLSVEDLINEGESHRLEFKSSLRWDYKESKMNRKLEEVVLKTIAAFYNSDGGVLVIGVSDDGEILGLDNDYQTLNGDRDRFEQHILNIIDTNYGKGFSAQFISLKIHQQEDSEICVIEISRGESPIFTSVTDKNGQKSEKFFLRRGNASTPIDNPSEINSYIKSRFNNN